MQKISTTCLCILAGASMAIYANAIDLKPVTDNFGQVKQINVAGHASTPRVQSPSRADQVVTVPFAHTLGKNEMDTNTGLYTQIDANGDEKIWKIGGFTGYSVCLKPADGGPETMDDWLVSPAIALNAGVDYTISFEYGNVLASCVQEKMGVYIGTGNTVEDFTTAIIPTFTFNTDKNFETKTATFSVAADGNYYLGFHACSNRAESGNIKLCNLSVVAGVVEAVEAPAAGTIEYSVFPKGELKAHVKYTAPTLTVNGSPLARIDKVEIVNRWYEKFEYTDVEPGSVIELDVELYQGDYNNRIEATAYVNDANGKAVAGETALVTGIYGGLDNPQPLTNVHATASVDGNTVTLTWDPASEVGESGGYVDVDKVVYYIFDAFGSFFDPAIAVTTETTYTFDYSGLTKPDFMAYQVTAGVDETYYSLATNSNIVAVGPAAALPFEESFADKRFQHIWVVDPESSYFVNAGTVGDNYLQTNIDDEGAEPEYLNSQDGDNGFLFMLPTEPDDMYGLISEKVALGDAITPALQFYYQGKGSVLDVMISTDGADLATAETIDLKENPTDGWTLYSLDLTPYLGCNYMQFELRLRAIHNDDTHTWSVPIDNIRVLDLNTVGAGSVTVPTAPIEIYTLSGVKVSGTPAPGIYIIRQGTEVRKEIRL